jgi:hypothetical protein
MWLRVLTASDWLWAVGKAGGSQGTVRVGRLVARCGAEDRSITKPVVFQASASRG